MTAAANAQVLDAARIKAVGRGAGLDEVGIAPATPFHSTRVILEERRATGLHGGMSFTYRNPERSTDPRRTLPDVAALVVGARAYRAPARSSGTTTNTGRVAAYAREDHYAALRAALHAVADVLTADGWKARVVADDNALVDREAAYRAGIGWYGKSSNVLLPRRGSWFVLGAVLTTAPLTPDVPVDDGCGACRRCIDGCPTGAIVAPGVVDARRCLAWLLQARGTFPVEFRAALGDRLYGCDDCQEACPPNRRGEGDAVEDPGIDLLALLEADDATLLERHGRWYIADRDPRHLRRNALIALGNTASPNDDRAMATLAHYAAGDDPMLNEHAAWAVDRVTERHARPA